MKVSKHKIYNNYFYLNNKKIYINEDTMNNIIYVPLYILYTKDYRNFINKYKYDKDSIVIIHDIELALKINNLLSKYNISYDEIYLKLIEKIIGDYIDNDN